MKKLLVGLTLTATALAITGCTKKEDTAQVANSDVKVVKFIGKDNPPYSDLVEFAREELKKENIDLQIQYVNDSLMPNRAVAANEADLNFYQHKSYLDSASALNKWDLEVVSYTFNTIFGGYSPKYKSLNELPNKASVTIPADTGNNGRSLRLLEEVGLIKLKPNTESKTSQADIIENPKQLRFIEVEQPMLPTAYKDSDLTLITGAYTAHAGLVPRRDALFKETPDEYYTAVLVGNKESVKKPEVQRVKAVFESEEARKYVLDNFSDVVTWER